MIGAILNQDAQLYDIVIYHVNSTFRLSLDESGKAL